MTRAIVNDVSLPPLHNRNYFHMSGAMYDAWAAYDNTASPYVYGQRLSAPDVETARAEAMSYATYGLIKHRFVTGPGATGGAGAATTLADIRAQMTSQGYDPDNSSIIGDSPLALGNRIAQAYIAYGMNDGANEANKYAIPTDYYAPVNAPLNFSLPGAQMNDPSKWQPLRFLGGQTDKVGKPLPQNRYATRSGWSTRRGAEGLGLMTKSGSHQVGAAM